MFRSSYLLKVFTFAVGFAILGFAASATAQAMDWTAGAGTDAWSTGGNWSPAGPPTPTDDVYIDIAGIGPPPAPVLDMHGDAQNLILGNTTAGELTVPDVGNDDDLLNDWNLTVSANIYLGRATGTTSKIMQDGGIVTVATLWGGSTVGGQTGAGVYEMTGGQLDVGGTISLGNQGTATFTQSSGTVNNPCSLYIGDAGWPGAAPGSVPGGPGSATVTIKGDAVFNGAPSYYINYLGPWGGYGELTVEDYGQFSNHILAVDLASSANGAATGIINLHDHGQITLSNTLDLARGPLSTGTLNQDGGTLTVPTLMKGAGTANYNFTGGTLNVSNVNNMDLLNQGGTVNVAGDGVVGTLTFNRFNVALGKTATQSSTYGGDVFPAGNAVDGNYDNFSHTGDQAEVGSWWRVDLTGDDSNVSIDQIDITPRNGCCTCQMSNFCMRVIDKDGFTQWQDNFITTSEEILGLGETLSVSPDGGPYQGRYVEVQLNGYNLCPNGWLSIAELVVPGDRYDYTQQDAGTLAVELDPDNDACDKLIAGALTLDGTLDVTSLGGTFSAWQVFDILDWDTLSGTFDTVSLPTLPSPLSWDTSELYTTGELTVVPEPSSSILLILGMLGGIVFARLRR